VLGLGFGCLVQVLNVGKSEFRFWVWFQFWGFRSCYKDFVLIQVYPVSSLSFNQSKQLDSQNGKITTAVLLLHVAK